MTSTKEPSKRQARREEIRRREQHSRLIGLGLISVGVLFVAFLIIYPSLKPAQAIAAPQEVVRPQVDFNTVGDPNAPIRIDEYSDFQCSHCANFYRTTEKELMDTFVADGTVYFVYNTFGDFMGAASEQMGSALYCAGDQGKFWEMHDVIFSNTGIAQGTTVERRVGEFAKYLELDMGTFDDCFNGQKHKETLEQDVRDGTAAGVKATPSFVITYTVNGEVKTKLLEGAHPYDTFKQEIEAALAEMGL
jgi:protein-disulfide isomerase